MERRTFSTMITVPILIICVIALRQRRFSGSATIRFPTRKSRRLCASASCARRCGLTTNRKTGRRNASRSYSHKRVEALLLNDFGVFQHDHAAALGDFAFDGDGFSAGLGQLVIDRLLFADHEGS